MKKVLLILIGMFLAIQNVLAFGTNNYIERTVRYDVGLSTVRGLDSVGKLTWEFDKDFSKSPIFYSKNSQSTGSFYKHLDGKLEIRDPHGNMLGYIFINMNNEYVVCDKHNKILMSFRVKV